MTKPLGGICPIIVGEILYQFTSCVLCLQFHDAFVTYFFLNWVVLQLDVMNVFNLVSKGVIFQEFHALGGFIIQLIPFVHAFYEFESPLFYSHHNHDGDVMVIPSAMGTRQGDPSRGALFALAHLRALKFTASHFPSCLFPSIVNDIHIIDPLPLYPLHMNSFKLNFV
jgi:hypothetical protein